MRMAFSRLGWSTAAFWAATPGELAAGLGRSAGEAVPMNRGALANLMRLHPDGKKDEEANG